MMTPSSTRATPDYPFPESDRVARSPAVEESVIAGAAGRVAGAAATARDQLAEAALDAQARAEAFRDSAASYVQCYPFRSVFVSAALGFLVGLLVARLSR